MKKILIVATVYSHIGQFHQSLINMLKENDCEIHICGRNNLAEKKGLKIENVDKYFNMPFERNPFSIKNIKCYKELKKIIKEEKYDIIHCNTPVGGVVTRLAAKSVRRNGTKIIYTAHGFHFYKGGPFKNWLIYYPIEKYLAKYTDILITINKEDFCLAQNKFKKCKNVQYVPGVGVDINKFNISLNDKEKSKYIHELGISQDDFVLICIGELNNNKNQVFIIDAMKKIILKYKNIKLFLVGNGPNKEYLENKIKEYNLENNIKLLGYRRDIPELLYFSNIAISASKREGLPVNVIEALSSGKPVIVTSNRGHKDIVMNGKNGYLVNQREKDDLMKKIEILYLNKEKYIEMSNDIYQSIEKFSLENVINIMKNIYFLK